MARKRKNHYLENIEPFNRYCPICGEPVKKGSTTHRCSQDKLDNIEQDLLDMEEKLGNVYIGDERSYSDRMEESEFYLNEDFDITDEEENI